MSPDRRRRARRIACGLAAAALQFSFAAAPSAAQDPVGGKKHAIVIGINGTSSPFGGIPTLTFAGDDAREMATLLADTGWDVKPIAPREGTRSNIVKELARLAREAGPNDTVLIYFAGHGIRDPGPGSHTYWVTYDVSRELLQVEGIRLTHLLDYIDEIPAQRKMVILDHCYSGDVEIVTGDGGGPGADRAPEGGVQMVRKAFPVDDFRQRVEQNVPKGLVILGAAREEAYEFPDLEHGIFTWVFLKALKDPRTDADENGRLSVAELSGRVREELRALTTAKAIKQVPIEVVRGSDISSWEPFDAVVGGAQALRSYVAALDLQTAGGIDVTVQSRIFAAINRWDAARNAGLAPDPKDQKIVDLIHKLRDLEDSVDAETKSQMLVSRVEAL